MAKKKDSPDNVNSNSQLYEMLSDALEWQKKRGGKLYALGYIDFHFELRKGEGGMEVWIKSTMLMNSKECYSGISLHICIYGIALLKCRNYNS